MGWINDKGFRGARQAAIARDDGRCRYCGIETVRMGGTNGPDAQTVDHVIPTSKGGRGVLANLVTACYECNYHKGSQTLQEAGMVMLPKPVWTREQVTEWRKTARSGCCIHCGVSNRSHYPGDLSLPHGTRRRRCRWGGTLFMPANVVMVLKAYQHA